MTRILRHLPDALIVLGLLAVAAGAALVYLPAGLIVGGGAGIALGAVLNHDQATSARASAAEGPS